MNELLPCPFCGVIPEIPDGIGTQYEIECHECGMAISSVQICDLMTIDERINDGFNPNLYKYPDEFIERAKKEAVTKWNRRTKP